MIESFIGLTKKAAYDAAERSNMIIRLICVNGRQLQTYPEDTRDDRVCVEIDGGVVVKATVQ